MQVLRSPASPLSASQPRSSCSWGKAMKTSRQTSAMFVESLLPLIRYFEANYLMTSVLNRFLADGGAQRDGARADEDDFGDPGPDQSPS